MKAKWIVLLLLLLLVQASPVAAADWVLLEHRETEGNDPGGDMYYDRDSVSKEGDSIYFWWLVVLDQPPEGSATKYMFRQQAVIVSPREMRVLEMYAYDANNNVLLYVGVPTKFVRVPIASSCDRLIDAVLPYAK